MLWLATIGGLPALSGAQVLRIGGFDFNARARTELVYSTNIERIRPGEDDEPEEDYYALVGLDLTSSRPVGRRTTLDLSTGISIEKHFVRDDLDNSQSPFGRFALQSSTEAGRLTLKGFVTYERLSDTSSDAFSPDARGKARDPHSERTYGVGAIYRAARITAGFDYEHEDEEHDEEQFSDRNLQEDTLDAYVAYQVHERFNPMYRYEVQDSVFPDNPASDKKEVNHRFILPFVLIRQKPQLQYAFSWQKEDRDDGNEPEWKPRHTITASDQHRLTHSLTFGYFASYDNYPQPAEDQIDFTYGAQLQHLISRTAFHSLSVSRKPVSTFGSTLESDQTIYSYMFTKKDLFIYDLTLALGIDMEHTIPKTEDGVDNDPQDILRYDIGLNHKRAVTRRMNRTIEYFYSYEDDSSQVETLTEHRVTLRYDYQF